MSDNDRTIRIGGIDWPEPLIDALHEDRLVVFAGAGVSMGEPACLPSVRGLVEAVLRGTGETISSEEPLEMQLSVLEAEGIDVRGRAARILRDSDPQPTTIHQDVLRMFGDISRVRVITTNYDDLFEKAAGEISIENLTVYNAPALPASGDFAGVVHVHGNWKHPEHMVLTGTDYGRAYLIQGRSRELIARLFNESVVLFIGYSHNDIVVSYLASALGDQAASQRYVLTPDENLRRWSALGTTPITYDPQPDHRNLRIAVHALADFADWSDADWEREVARIAIESVSSLSLEDEGILRNALQRDSTSGFFTKYATSPDWVRWLDANDFLSGLVGDGHGSNVEEQLALWVANSIAVKHPDAVFALIARRQSTMNPRFSYAVALALVRSSNDELTSGNLAKWVSVLTSKLNGRIDPHFAEALIERCKSFDDRALEISAIFDHLLATRVLNEIPLLDGPRVAGVQNSGDVAWSLRTIWGSLNDRIFEIANPLVESIVRHVHTQHRLERAWGFENPNQTWNVQFKPLRTGGLDSYDPPSAVIVSMAAEALEWMSNNQNEVAEDWLRRLCGSAIVVLRRLAVRIITNLPWSSERKIEALSAMKFSDDLDLEYEVLEAIGEVYADVGENVRKQLLDAILDDARVRECLVSADHLADLIMYEWLCVLRQSDPECAVASEMLEPILLREPRFDPEKFVHTRAVVVQTLETIYDSPLDVNALLSKPASECVDEVLSCEPATREIYEGGRLRITGVNQAVGEAASREIEWGLRFATELVRRYEWRSDIWRKLIEVWEKHDLNGPQHRKVLGFFRCPEMIESHGAEIGRSLRQLVENGDKPFAKQLIPEAKHIAGFLWEASATETPRIQGDNWLMQSMNSIAGDVVAFWMSAIWLQNDRGRFDPMRFEIGDREFINLVVDDGSHRGKIGKVILAQRLGVLAMIDTDWVKTRMLPSFDLRDPAAIQVWDGMAAIRFIPPVLGRLLRPYFLAATQGLQDKKRWGGRELRQGFIDRFVNIMFLYEDDPIADWIPAFFNNCDAADRATFAQAVTRLLKNEDDSGRAELWQRWLKTYWQDRLEGVPDRLNGDEVSEMLQWPKHLTPVFDDAVEIAIRMPAARPEHMSVSHLVDADLAKAHPNGVAQLLVFVDQEIQPDSWAWYNVGPIIEALQASDLDEGTKARLSTIQERYGIDATA